MPHTTALSFLVRLKMSIARRKFSTFNDEVFSVNMFQGGEMVENALFLMMVCEKENCSEMYSSTLKVTE